MRTICFVVTFFLVSLSALGQETYYKAIQKTSPNPLSPSAFKQLEEDALKEYSLPARYDGLANAFGSSTEKVWAVVYGEVFCNLSTDRGRTVEIGGLVFQWYDRSLTKKTDGLSVNLTENAESPRKGL